MKLKKLHLKNFKGLPEFTFSTNGGDTTIYGDNGTGKTTIFDGFTWLLFGKDSLNSATFDIKTLEGSGESKHGLEHTVEGLFSANGSDISLKKTLVEKWVKKRGSAHREFTGHTVNHFIDGVPVKKKEYDESTNSICDENIFKLLTNPRYFNEVLHWQERRKTLIEVCGDVSDEDVIKSDPELAGLPHILKKRKLEDHRKVIASRRAEINKELDKIPVRIDEARGGLAEVRVKQNIESDIANAKDELKTSNEVLKEIQAGGESEVLITKLREVENKISAIDNVIAQNKIKAMSDRAEKRRSLKDEAVNIGGHIAVAVREKEDLISRKTNFEKNIERVKDEIVGLRERWHEEDARTFEFEQSSVCPSCGQSLPEEKLEGAREKALSVFNKAKAKALTSITEEGKTRSDGIKEYGVLVKELADKLQAVEIAIKTLLDHKDKAEKALKDFDEQPESTLTDDQVYHTPERESLLEKRESLKKQIREKKGSIDSESIRDGEAQIEAIEIRIQAYNKELLQIDANKRIDVRIKELSDQERRLSAEFEELERQLYITEQFIRTKVGMLEERINSRFKLARFQLFTVNINGGLEETCNTTVNGIPYNSMNNAARINSGLDICNTLSEHFGKSLPLFIDNAEAVTELLLTPAQQIRLVVSAQDETLRIEYKGG